MFFVELIQFVDAAKGKDTLDRGNYEFPFEIEFPGHMPESLEGLYDSWIVYRLKATIERGKFAHNLHARKHLRVVRTLDPSSLELVHSMVCNHLPNACRSVC
jgi:arrestin-related trafficking adapter 4/5/7